MTNNGYNLWKLAEPPEDDPRTYLDVIISKVQLGVVQAIQYRENKVFVISEEQYSQIEKYLVV